MRITKNLPKHLRMGCQTFVTELSSHYSSTSPAMYASSLLSHCCHILGSNSIITWNLGCTIAYIDIHHVELSSHNWMCGKNVLGCKGNMGSVKMGVEKCVGGKREVKGEVWGRYGEPQHSTSSHISPHLYQNSNTLFHTSFYTSLHLSLHPPPTP